MLNYGISHGRSLVAQCHRTHWLRWAWRRIEPVVSLFAVAVLAIGYVVVKVLGRSVLPFIGGMVFALYLTGLFIR